MVRTSDLTDRISELLKRSMELTAQELEELAQYGSDGRIVPVDKFNIGLVFHRRREFLDALQYFGDALESYETADEKNLRIYTLAHVGEAIKAIGDTLMRAGKQEDGFTMYHQAAHAYGEVLERLDKVLPEALPVTLANAATIFYNIRNYPQALQICTTYQTLGLIRQFATEKTDAVIDTILTRTGTKIKPVGEG